LRQLGIASALFLIVLHQAADATCVKFEPAITTLRGTVVPTMFYGPPNFGEYPKHDQRGIYPVLRLDKPVRICTLTNNDGDMTSNKIVREMQMIFYEGPLGRNWNGKHVLVHAKLFPWDNAFHHTPVMLSVVSIGESS
jgi:hypothetical protein